MKKALLLLLAAAAALWLSKHPDETKSRFTAACKSLSAWFGSLAGDAAPDAGKEPAADADLLPAIGALPADVHCLLQPVRVSSDSTSTLLPAGSLVQKTGEGGGKVVITDGTGSAIIEAGMLTQDPAVIASLLQKATLAAQAGASMETSQVQQQISELDAKLAQLRAELKAIRERDAKAAKSGQTIRFATSEAFVQSNITMLERRRGELLKQLGTP